MGKKSKKQAPAQAAEDSDEESQVIEVTKGKATDVSTMPNANTPPPAPGTVPAFKFNFGAPAAGVTAGLANLSVDPSKKGALMVPADKDEDDDEDGDGDDDEQDEAAMALAEVMEKMPPAMVARLLKLKGLEMERDTVVEEYKVERCALEAKYRAKYAPLYAQRKGVVTGAVPVPMPEELKTAAGGGEDEAAGIPKFWLQAMARRGLLAELIEEIDLEALASLEDVRCVDAADMTGFTLEFEFGANPFFTNTVLTKTYEVGNLLSDDEPMLEKVTGCKIDWKEGKCLTFEEKEKKQRAKKGKNKGQTRIVKESVKRPSFFHFFSPQSVEDLQSVEDPDEGQAMMDAFNMDYSAACLLRSEVVPHAVLCFTGEMQDSDDEDDEDDEDFDGEFDDEDDDEELEEDDGDDDDDDEPKGRGRGGKQRKGKGGGGKGKGSQTFPVPANAGKPPPAGKGGKGGDANPECKQS